MPLSELMLQTAALRSQMDILVSHEQPSVEELEVLAGLFHQQIVFPQPEGSNAAEYANFLQQNLDWLNTFIDKLSVAKQAVATELLKIQKGKKAKQGYSENN